MIYISFNLTCALNNDFWGLILKKNPKDVQFLNNENNQHYPYLTFKIVLKILIYNANNSYCPNNNWKCLMFATALYCRRNRILVQCVTRALQIYTYVYILIFKSRLLIVLSFFRYLVQWVYLSYILSPWLS